jgi:hypothetical protein
VSTSTSEAGRTTAAPDHREEDAEPRRPGDSRPESGGFGDGSAGLIGAPWDSVVVAAVGVTEFVAGTRAAARYLADNPVPEPLTAEL